MNDVWVMNLGQGREGMKVLLVTIILVLVNSGQNKVRSRLAEGKWSVLLYKPITDFSATIPVTIPVTTC